MKQWFTSLANMGVYPHDDETVVLKKQFLVFQGLLMGGGGLLWGFLVMNQLGNTPSLIPFSFVAITTVNLCLYALTRQFFIARNVQTVASLFLPFLFMWCMGGYQQAIEIMFWALVALVTSMSYLGKRESFFWFGCLVVLIVISFVADDWINATFNLGITAPKPPLLMAANIISIATIIFALMLYFFTMNDKNMRKVKEAYQQLIETEKRTARLDTLARLASEMAHEVQNPLQFVNNFSEVNLELIADLQESKDEDGFAEIANDLLINSQKINEHGKRISIIVSQLQEQTDKARAGELDLPEENPHNFSK